VGTTSSRGNLNDMPNEARSRSEARSPNRRILIVDDNAAIHLDFRKVLCPSARGAGLKDLESSLFGSTSSTQPRRPEFEVDSAYQGRAALEKVVEMQRRKLPYALAFVDMRMPPGWDGVETVEQLWTVQKDLRVVFCSAYSDYSWQDVVARLGNPGLRWLRKPFATRDVLELANELTAGGPSS
jgi:CheY-like chemotaxis protein